MPHEPRRLILSVIKRAAAKLDAERAAGLLTQDDCRYVGALERLALGWGRSGQHRGVFIFGLADVKASQDAEYWTGAIVHDGVHALLQARGRPYLDEVGPCEAQIGYLIRTGAQDALVASVIGFRDSRARQRSRSREPI